MRFLLIACLLFLLVRVATLPVAGAAHQVCPQLISDQASVVSAQPGVLLINEVVLSSSTPWNCPNTTIPPDITDTSWIEIYNPQDQPINLYTSHASIDGADSSSTAAIIRFPFGTAIASHGFITVFGIKSGLFSNKASPYTLRLLIAGIPVDQVTLPLDLGMDQSYGRVSDGAPQWQINETPTIGISNVLPTPTPKPKPTHTPATRHPVKGTSKSPVTPHKSAPIQAHTATASDSNTSDVAISNGVQPIWDRLALPDGTPPAHTSSSATNVHAVDGKIGSPGVGSDTGAVERKILITTLVVVIVGVLYGCWQRFRRLRARKTLK